MSNKKVLVAYASKHGSTAEIAQAIASALNQAGVDAKALPAKEVKDITPYAAIIIGSAIYMNTWLKDAASFLQRFKKILAERPVWLFQAGPLDTTAESSVIPLGKRIESQASAIKICGHITFGGKLTKKNPGMAEKLLSRRGLEGDFRDFDRIKLWAESIAREINNPGSLH